VCRGQRPPVHVCFPDIFAALMQVCWNQEPDTRPSSAVVVRVLAENVVFDENVALLDDNALCRYRFSAGFNFGVAVKEQSRNMTVFLGLETRK
jgi:hypothetical protein